MSASIECPICYEVITNVNCVTTECCHKFHASCLFKNMTNNVDCPLCRKELVELPEEDDEETEYETEEEDNESEYDSDENTDDETTESHPLPKVTITQIMVELKKKNINERQIIATLLKTIMERSCLDENVEYKPEDMNEYYRILNHLDDIVFGEVTLDQRDSRTYADVLNGKEAETERGIGPNIISL